MTTWSKFDTRWEGVTIDALLADAGIAALTPWLLALSLDDHDTNVPVADLLGGRAMVATHFDGRPLAPEHGGPARLLRHPVLWERIKGSKFTARDEADLGAADITFTAILGGSNAIRTILDDVQRATIYRGATRRSSASRSSRHASRAFLDVSELVSRRAGQ